jgi:hypothetical protein
MLRHLLLLCLLLSAVPARAASVPDVGPKLDLPPLSLPATYDEVKVKTIREVNPFMKVLPIALVLPMGVAGVSIHDSAPIAWDLGDGVSYSAMRGAGLGLMGGAYGLGIAFNAITRTSRMMLGGKWTDDLWAFIAGIAASTGGYVLTSIGGGAPVVTGNTPLAAGLLVSGGVAWGAGMVFLMVDSVKTAWTLEAKLSASNPSRGLRLADAYVVPQKDGLAMGITLAW